MNTFSYKTIKSKRRTLAIEIKADKSVIVRAPYSCPDTVILGFIESKCSWVEKHLKAMPEPEAPMPENEIKALREKAKAYLPQRVKYWSDITGLTPSAVKITSAKHRFGSCSGKNSICFSLFLMQYPADAIDYVIVHELCHIKHKNHSEHFHALLRKYLPDSDAKRARLRQAPK